MKSKTIISAIAAAAMGLGSLGNVAFAQDHRDDHHQRGGPDRGHDHGRGPGPSHGPDRGPDRGPGAGPDHNFYRGGRLPSEYRNRQYVVDDWRGHHLSAPPRGYHWVQTGGDYVLAAIATGVIASILLNH